MKFLWPVVNVSFFSVMTRSRLKETKSPEEIMSTAIRSTDRDVQVDQQAL